MAKKKSVPAKAKLTKKEAHKQQWAPANLHIATSDFLSETMDAMANEYNSSDICVAGEAGRILVGVPCPSLAFEYLIQNTVYPFGRISQIVGAEGSCKSAFGFEIVRWCRRRCGGLGVLFENEHKYSPDYAMSILGHDDPGAMGHVPCEDMEDWQSKIQFWLARAKKRMTGTKESPGSGRVWPAVLILDSLTGSLARATVGNIEKEGFAQRRFALEAMMITDFMKKLPEDMRRWPFTLLVVNHLKKKLNEGGPAPRPGADRHKPGGVHMSFQETFEFQLNRLTGRPQKKAKWTEIPLNIELHKNSLGENRRNIDVNLKYWYAKDEASGQMRQHSIWDWHESTIDLLTTLDEPGMKKEIKQIVDLNVASGPSGKTVWSKTLGISEREPVSYNEAGQILNDNAPVLDGLRDLFGIKRRKPFQPGVDYLNQLELEQSRIEEEIAHAESLEVPRAEARAVAAKNAREQTKGAGEIEQEMELDLGDDE